MICFLLRTYMWRDGLLNAILYTFERDHEKVYFFPEADYPSRRRGFLRDTKL